MASSYIYIERAGSLHLFGDNKLDYKASCQLQWSGDERATMHTTNGPTFYQMLAEMDFAPFRELGLRIVDAHVSPAHYRLIRMALRKVASVKDAGPILMRGHWLRRIEIEDLQPRVESPMEKDP